MDPTRSERIVDELVRRGVTKPCPRCGHERFDVVAETGIHIQPEPGVKAVVPAVMIACANCGYLNYHALASIGMMPEVARAG